MTHPPLFFQGMISNQENTISGFHGAPAKYSLFVAQSMKVAHEYPEKAATHE